MALEFDIKGEEVNGQIYHQLIRLFNSPPPSHPKKCRSNYANKKVDKLGIFRQKRAGKGLTVPEGPTDRLTILDIELLLCFRQNLKRGGRGESGDKPLGPKCQRRYFEGSLSYVNVKKNGEVRRRYWSVGKF